MRNQLAAIDFNAHRGRKIAKTAEGKERYVSVIQVFVLLPTLSSAVLLQLTMLEQQTFIINKCTHLSVVLLGTGDSIAKEQNSGDLWLFWSQSSTVMFHIYWFRYF